MIHVSQNIIIYNTNVIEHVSLQAQRSIGRNMSIELNARTLNIVLTDRLCIIHNEINVVDALNQPKIIYRHTS